ncbi:flagellar motor protein MotD [Porticoccaceae bacterium LTM1]|nr:flagellar motor protein MotD [Porticoccaceae bacterium LTM1]
MARKKKHEEHENHERWLVSYADFITLLFAFFVVMYSISSVNEGKYRVLSESLNAAFRSSARALNPIQVGQPVRSPQIFAPKASMSPQAIVSSPIRIDIHTPMPNVNSPPLAALQGKEVGGGLEKMSKELEEAFKKLIDDKVVSVRKNPFQLEVEINTQILFQSGSSVLSPSAIPVIKQLSDILDDFNNQVQVEGFTDNQPIRSSIYPSNWELSAGRAATVVRLFAENGITPGRLSSVGYGEFRPITSNDTEAGRARNRRVVIVVKASQYADNQNMMDALRDNIGNVSAPGTIIPAPTSNRAGRPAMIIPVSPEVRAAEELL